MASTEPFLDLRDATDPSAAGGKAAGLAQAMGRGLPVPDGFVVRVGEAAVRDDVARALDRLGGRVAVRSSAPGEDGVESSFAGMYESVLDLDEVDAVVDAIERCRHPGPHALAYAASRGTAAPIAAVLVQRMVRARVAGVAFTADPLTGDRTKSVISAVSGLGGPLAQGVEVGETWTVVGDVATVAIARGGLTADEALRVADMARATGSEMDVEWAIDDRAWLLQARPMTGLPPHPWVAPAPGAWTRNFRLGEWIGAPVTPLFETGVLPVLEEGMHAAAERELGLRTPRPLHVLVNGWAYYGGLNYVLSAWEFVRLLPRWALALRHERTRALLLAGHPRLARYAFDAALRAWRTQTHPAFLAELAAVAEAEPVALPAALPSLADRLVAATASQAETLVTVAGYAAKAEVALRAVAPERVGEVRGLPVQTAHDVEGLDPVFPTRGERAAAAEPAPRPAPSGAPASSRVARLLAEACRAHAGRQEVTRAFTEGWPLLRRILLRAGGALVEAGTLSRPDDVFFLTREELDLAFAGSAVSVEGRRAAWERSRRLAPPLVLGEPVGIGKIVFPALERFRARDDEHIVGGMAASPGEATGTARVIRSVDDLGRLQRGDVLVAPVATPLWSVAFDRAAAVVTDSGSAASHASIVAREYGIPAVVATGNATLRIRDGSRVTVDGHRGLVRLFPP